LLRNLRHYIPVILKKRSHAGIEELFARIRSVLRRRKVSEPLVLKLADLVVDTKKHEVVRAGKVIHLTPKEYRLLDMLMRNPGQALSRRQLMNNAWGPEFSETNNELNVHVRYLRKKIDSAGLKKIIHTVRGVGFAIKE